MITPEPNFLVSPAVMELIYELGPRTHAGTATVMSARVERPLEWLIQAQMPNLSNRMKPRMFEGYGSLSSFAAKIDFAFALGFIDADLSRSLHAIREIRNEFAHADEDIHFHHPRLLKLVEKLPNRGKKDPFAAFLDECTTCATALGAQLERVNRNKIRRSRRASRAASLQKSA